MKICMLGLVLAGAAGFLAGQELPSAVVKAADIKWVEAKGLPPGSHVCVLHGDPAKGASVVMLKFAAGVTVPAHWHSSDEVVTVNSGSALFGWGDKVDESKGILIEDGAYITIPAKKTHWAVMKSDAVLTKYSNGIGDFNPCK